MSEEDLVKMIRQAGHCQRHLQAMVDSGYEYAVGDCDDRHCFHCGEWLDEEKYLNPHMKDRKVWDSLPDKHSPDCPYLAAKAFLETCNMFDRCGLEPEPAR